MATKHAWSVGLLALGALWSSVAVAQEDPLMVRLRDSCSGEIRELCSKVTPGNGRLIACLYAHEDELSGRCDYVLLEAASQLTTITAQMNEVARVCKPDIELLCNGAEPGQGRIARCLRSQQKALSVPCADTIEKTGLDVK